jgi:ribosome assembly protein RRB1
MSKRSAASFDKTKKDDHPSKKPHSSGSRISNIPVDEMGEFEDAWEDEIDDEEQRGDEKGPDGKFSFSLCPRTIVTLR